MGLARWYNIETQQTVEKPRCGHSEEPKRRRISPDFLEILRFAQNDRPAKREFQKSLKTDANDRRCEVTVPPSAAQGIICAADVLPGSPGAFRQKFSNWAGAPSWVSSKGSNGRSKMLKTDQTSTFAIIFCTPPSAVILTTSSTPATPPKVALCQPSGRFPDRVGHFLQLGVWRA